MVARRKKRQDVAPVVEEVPAWIWQFRFADWPDPDHPGRGPNGEIYVAGHVAMRRRWSEAVDAWLNERGLVLWPQSSPRVTYTEYQRIRREEPWRILRRPHRRALTPRGRPSAPPTTTTPDAASP